jgi:hypothetical protein
VAAAFGIGLTPWRPSSAVIQCLRPGAPWLGLLQEVWVPSQEPNGGERQSLTGPNEWIQPLVVDLDVAEEAPSPNLDLGTLARFHVDALIPEERGSAGGYPGAWRDLQSDVADQVEDAKDGSLTRRPGAEVQPHIADKDHDLFIGPSDREGALSHIAQEREHRRSSRRTSSGAGAPDPEPGRCSPQND